MFGIGAPELMLILIVGLVVFGPGKLPEIGRTLGKTINEFRKFTSSITLEPQASTPVSRPAQSSPANASKPAAEVKEETVAKSETSSEDKAKA